MMKNVEELTKFVYRANTHEKINIAFDWIEKNVEDDEIFEKLAKMLEEQEQALCNYENYMCEKADWWKMSTKEIRKISMLPVPEFALV